MDLPDVTEERSKDEVVNLFVAQKSLGAGGGCLAIPMLLFTVCVGADRAMARRTEKEEGPEASSASCI